MPRYFCHENPDLLAHSATIVAARDDAVLLDRSAFYPGGGGQLPDRGTLTIDGRTYAVTDLEAADTGFWHRLDGGADPSLAAGHSVEVAVDEAFRDRMKQIHTALHILNALVYQEFDGALTAGVQMADDDTARIDFDLPGADNARLRALEPRINAIIEAAVPVGVQYLAEDQVAAEPGIVRSRSVAPPPTDDGLIRIVEIDGVDRQACGGTHVTDTARIRPVQILKVENKGKHFRRVRIGLKD